MADNMNVTVRDPLAPRRQMPPIVIGRAGEYGATTVTFDLRGFIDRYGAGVPTLLHKRPPDDEAYIVPLSAADTETHDRTEMPDPETLVWHVGQVATSYVGNGKIELQWHPDGAAKKSAQFDVVVLGTIGNPVSEIPDAQQIYLDVMQGIADDAEDAADRAEAAVSHYPRIQNGTWCVWDVTNSEWVDTGVSAQGPVGPAGTKGNTGFSPEIRVTDITGGHRLDIYNELGYETVDVMDGIDGTDGEDGEDGVSPTVTVEEIEGGHRVTITDAGGAHPFDVLDGEGGSGSGAVESVNGKTGVVVLDAFDVGALPDDTPIPAAVTEQTVAGWGFTKNTGTYSKPSGGIPKSDLASAVQTSLSKADTALQPDALQTALDDNVPPVQFVLVRNGNTLSTVETFVNIAYSFSYKPRRIMFVVVVSQSGGTVTSALELYPTMIDTNSRALTLAGYFDGNRYTAELTAASPSSTMTGTLVVEPIVTETDVQKAINGVRQLPTVTASDNGKFLRVVSGAWAAQTVQTWQGGSY